MDGWDGGGPPWSRRGRTRGRTGTATAATTTSAASCARCAGRPDNRVLGGVCGAVSAETGIDVTWVRIGFVLLAIASGVMVFVYAMAWLLIPMEGETSNIYSRAVNDRRGIRLVAAILIPLLIALQSSRAPCTSPSSASSGGRPSSPSASSS